MTITPIQSNNCLNMQINEFDSLIDIKLPDELLLRVFSFLPYRNITATYCVSKKWSAVSLDLVRRREAMCFKSFIHFIADNITDEKNEGTKAKIKDLITEVRLSEDVVINLLDIKETLLEARSNLSTLLKELGSVKINALSILSIKLERPLFFWNILANRGRLQNREVVPLIVNPALQGIGVVERMNQAANRIFGWQ